MRILPVALGMLAVVYALVVLAMFPRWTVDDAYIIARYAQNLASHGELTWNVGEDPVEGYTGILLPFVLAMVIKAGGSAILASRMIGIFSFFFGGLMVLLVLGKLGITDAVKSCVLCLYLAAPFMFTHALSGLETLLFSSVTLACVLILLNCTDGSGLQAAKETALLGCLLLACLTRPEGIALSLTFICALWFIRTKEQNRSPIGFVFRCAMIYVLPYSVYFLWRWQYYGQLLPNTFYAKSYAGILNANTARGLLHFFLGYLLWPVLACVLLNVVEPQVTWQRVRQGLIRQMSRRIVVVYASLATFVSLVILQYCTSVLKMNFSYRFFVPLFPIALLGIGVSAHLGWVVLAESRNRKPVRYRILVLLVIALALLQTRTYLRRLKVEATFADRYKQLLEDEHIPAGMFLRENVPSSEWLIVVSDAGAIPYFSGLATVDFGRLNDEILSRGNLAESEAVDYFYSFNAGAAVFTSREENRIDFTAEAARIVNDRRFQRYVLARKYSTTARRDYFEFVFLRKDLCR